MFKTDNGGRKLSRTLFRFPYRNSLQLFLNFFKKIRRNAGLHTSLHTSCIRVFAYELHTGCIRVAYELHTSFQFATSCIRVAYELHTSCIRVLCTSCVRVSAPLRLRVAYELRAAMEKFRKLPNGDPTAGGWRKLRRALLRRRPRCGRGVPRALSYYWDVAASYFCCRP